LRRIFYLLVGVSILVSCEKSGGSAPGAVATNTTIKDPLGSSDGNSEIAILALIADAGPCNQGKRGKTYYVLQTKKFQFCNDSDAWEEIDIKGASGSAGANGQTSLISVVNESAGGNCAGGGHKIMSGLDANNNGQLDSSEVTSTSYSCHGATGQVKQSLVLATQISSGTQCAAGGNKVETGIDDNGDNALQAGEVDSTSYVCNGLTGAAGVAGFNSLVIVSSEAVGPNCRFGGSKIMVGLDNGDSASTARDGVLSPGEVDNTSYVCQALPGQRTIRVTDATINTEATDEEKDNFCSSEFGQSYVAATELDAVYNWPAVSYGWSVYGFGIAGKTRSILPQVFLEKSEGIYFTFTYAGAYKLACIDKFAPLRFTRGAIASNLSNAEKTALCQAELGSIYSSASVQDVTLKFTSATALNPPAWTARDTTFTYGIDQQQGKSRFLLARVDTPYGAVACRND
jgi:hypothetical protein